MARKTISKKKRFEVFKRDNFTCQYCSAKPPKVPLEVDHIQPVCKGGSNHIDNLITACFDCNRGKAGNELSNVPPQLSDKIERVKLAQSQYRQYQKLMKAEAKIMNQDIDRVDEVFNSVFEDYYLKDNFRLSVKKFIKILGVERVMEAMEIACGKIHYDENKALKYFCGICWTWIREEELL